MREKDTCQKSEHVRGMSVEAIVNGLRPNTDSIDRRILHELAGIGLQKSELEDDSSFEEEGEDADP